MTRNEFLSQVAESLAGLSQQDIDRSLEFYGEMIDDRIEDGESEADAVAAIGSPEEAARQILLDMPLPKIVKAKTVGERKLRAWEIVLLILGSPVWLPLLLAAAVIVLAVYIVIWTIAISLWATEVALAAVSLTSIFVSLILLGSGTPASALLFFGAGLALAGISIFLFLGCRSVTVLTAKLGALIWRAIKSMLVRGGDKQ